MSLDIVMGEKKEEKPLFVFLAVFTVAGSFWPGSQ